MAVCRENSLRRERMRSYIFSFTAIVLLLGLYTALVVSSGSTPALTSTSEDIQPAHRLPAHVADELSEHADIQKASR